MSKVIESDTQPAVAPSGRVVLVFTDIEGSTTLWEQVPDAMRLALELHHAVLRDLLDTHRGYEVKTEGDAFMVAFSDALEAVRFCLEAQLALMAADWPISLLTRTEAIEQQGARGLVQRGLRVRMGAHLGYPEDRPDPRTGLVDYHGPMVNRAARVAAAAHGGQVLVSGAVWDDLGARGGAVLRGVDVIDLGWHRLRGLDAPERLRQILPEALSGRSYPPVRTLEVRKSNLTPGPDSFVGRAADLAAIATCLAAGDRLVTLLGPGGTGKTRLSRRFAELNLGDYSPDGGGVWFCDLSDARTLSDVLTAAGTALGVPLGRSESASVTMLGHALADRGRLLLILDNFEQVADLAAATVESWLSLAPLARFLVTSRVPLNIAGEGRLPVSPLGMEEGVELFLARARAVRRDRALPAAEQEAVALLVHRLDGLPLAIELAAARTAILAPSAIVERLNQRFKVLAEQGGQRVARHRTLRAAIDWSWDLLNGWERAALAQCSVFVGAFSLGAAEAVIDVSEVSDEEPPWTLDLLHSLVEKSLLRDEPREDGETMFRLLESISSYAAEKLGDPAPHELRHAAWYAGWGRRLAQGLYGPHAIERQKQLNGEVENLIAVQRRLARRDGAERYAIEATLATHPLVYLRGPYEEGVLRLEAVVPAAEKLGDTALLAELLLARGQLEHMTARPAEAEATLRRALSLTQARPHHSVQGQSARALGNIVLDLGRVDEARALYQQAIDLHVDDAWLAALARINLGRAARVAGRLDEAQTLYERALADVRHVGDTRHEALVLLNLGVVAAQSDDLGRARAAYTSALPLLVRTGDRRGEASTRHNLGSICAAQGRWDEARSYFSEALEIFRELGIRGWQGETLHNILELHLDNPTLDGAADVAKSALDLNRQLGDASRQHLVLLMLGVIRYARHDLEGAREVLVHAAGLLAEGGDPRRAAAGAALLAVTLEGLGDQAGAEPLWRRATTAAADLPELLAPVHALQRRGGSAAAHVAPQDTNSATPGARESVELRLLRLALRTAQPSDGRAPIRLEPPGSTTHAAARYQLGAVLGRGGFGTVYRAEMLGEAGFRKTVAVKVLNPQLAGREDLACRLRDEARLLGLLSHRAIVAVAGLEKVGGDWAIVMEHIDGVSLNKVFALGPVPPRVAVEILCELASALHTAWVTRGPDGRALHLLHRDIKPGNVLISRTGDVKLLDFGIARAEFESREALTRGGGMGTPGYIAPERFEGRDGPEADIYCLGVLLYEMLSVESFGPGSGNPARHGARVATAIARLGARGPKPPESVTALLVQMLACDPGERPSAAEVERACEATLGTLSGERLRGWAGRVVSMLGSGSAPGSESHTTLAPDLDGD